MEPLALQAVWDRAGFDIEMNLQHWTIERSEGKEIMLVVSPDAVFSKKDYRNGADIMPWCNIEVKVPTTKGIADPLEGDPEYLLQIAFAAAALYVASGGPGSDQESSRHPST